MTIVKKRQELPVFGDMLSNLFEDNFFEPVKSSMIKKTPSVNIFENEVDFKIQLASPGMNKSDFMIDVHENVLTISARKSTEKTEKEPRYSIQEFNYSTFKRVFNLPKNINKEEVSAKYVDGILEISIPKLVEEKAIKQRIEIQ
ncbi:Hsp20/alpha crystallin family protein [Crocinitomix sp.]|nr:Hsp20/alpha crystallin family protein [Crocinitomix sp.]